MSSLPSSKMNKPLDVQTCELAHPALPALFDPTLPDNPVLWAVLMGRHSGRALVDDPLTPTECVLRTDTGLTFTSRQVRREFLHQAVDHFRREGGVWLVGLDWIDHASFAPRPDHISQRLEFQDYDPLDPALETLRTHLEQGFKIRRIDRELLDRCLWRDEMAFYCGSLENFLANALGLCLMHGEAIISEAYVSSFGDAYAEIGAITRPDQRGKGYAPIACAYLIQECEQRGYHGYWSCEVDNFASIRVARKLGFRRQKPYLVLEYEQLQ